MESSILSCAIVAGIIFFLGDIAQPWIATIFLVFAFIVILIGGILANKKQKEITK